MLRIVLFYCAMQCSAGVPSGAETEQSGKHAATTSGRAGSSEYACVPFTVRGAERTSVQAGNPHVTGGIRGENKYTFDGVVEFDGEKVPVSVMNWRVVAVVRSSDTYSILLQGAFDDSNFSVRPVKADGLAAEVPPRALPAGFGSIALEPRQLSYSFRCWLLRGMFERGESAQAERMFCDWAVKDPRWILDGSTNGRSGAVFVALCKDFLLVRRKSTFIDALRMCLRHAGPRDDAQVIDFLLLSLWKQSPQALSDAVHEMETEIQQQSAESDNRASAIRINCWRRGECPEPGSTDKP